MRKFTVFILLAMIVGSGLAYAAQGQAQGQNQNQNTTATPQWTQSQNQNQNQNQNRVFSDVPDDAWYGAQVREMAQLGVMQGDPDGTFDPGRYVNRAEMATVMARFRDRLRNEYQLIQQVDSMEVVENDTFLITLAANPTTGYEWQVNFDPAYLQLLSRTYSAEDPNLVGAGGEEVFKFEALKAGVTYIHFLYLRPFEPDASPIDRVVYKVNILPN